MKKFVLLFIAALTMALAVPALAANQPKLGAQRWQTLSGWASVDTLNWSDQGQYSLRDTVTGVVDDTTTSEIDITGCSYVSLFVIQSGKTAPPRHDLMYRVQISPDLGTWISYATAFSSAIGATGTITRPSDTTVVILYDQDLAVDTMSVINANLTVKVPVGRDMRLLRSGKYLRVIADAVTATGTDTSIVKAILRREWPEKTR